MPFVVPLEVLPVQEFQYTWEQSRFTIELRQVTDTLMIASVSRNGVPLITGQTVAANAPLIPFEYLDANLGNFHFETLDDSVPHYEAFGTTQQLLFVTPAELIEARGL